LEVAEPAVELPAGSLAERVEALDQRVHRRHGLEDRTLEERPDADREPVELIVDARGSLGEIAIEYVKATFLASGVSSRSKRTASCQSSFSLTVTTTSDMAAPPGFAVLVPDGGRGALR
jgi:hypothetical protein